MGITPSWPFRDSIRCLVFIGPHTFQYWDPLSFNLQSAGGGQKPLPMSPMSSVGKKENAALSSVWFKESFLPWSRCPICALGWPEGFRGNFSCDCGACGYCSPRFNSPRLSFHVYGYASASLLGVSFVTPCRGTAFKSCFDVLFIYIRAHNEPWVFKLFIRKCRSPQFSPKWNFCYLNSNYT